MPREWWGGKQEGDMRTAQERPDQGGGVSRDPTISAEVMLSTQRSGERCRDSGQGQSPRPATQERSGVCGPVHTRPGLR